MWAKVRRAVGAVGAAVGVMAVACGASAASGGLKPLLSRQLADVQGRLESFCAPRCGRVFLEASPETDAAKLEPTGSGASWVLYNERFFREVVGRYGRAAAYAVVAHEYGHHVDHVDGSSAWAHELRADAIAGCALARAGLPVRPALRWMRHEHFDAIWHHVYGDRNDPHEVLRTYLGSTHPYWVDRIGALKRGAEVCSAADAALALREFIDRTGTRAPEFATDSDTLFAELPFRRGAASSLAVAAPREVPSFGFGRYGWPAGAW